MTHLIFVSLSLDMKCSGLSFLVVGAGVCGWMRGSFLCLAHLTLSTDFLKSHTASYFPPMLWRWLVPKCLLPNSVS